MGNKITILDATILSEDGLSFQGYMMSNVITTDKCITKGKVYWESTILDDPNISGQLGITYNKNRCTGTAAAIWVGDSYPYGTFISNRIWGTKIYSWQKETVISCALDLDSENKTLIIRVNGVHCVTCELNTDAMKNALKDVGVTPMWNIGSQYKYFKYKANFGENLFKYPIPEGYVPYNKSDIYYAYKINPLSVYINKNTTLEVNTEDGHKLSLVGGTDNTILEDTDLSTYVFHIPYSDIELHEGLHLEIRSKKDNALVVREKLAIRKENLYRSNLARSFFHYELGYKLKNNKQKNKIQRVI